jgi:hypothetical protein
MVDKILKSTLKSQIPFLVCGTITRTITLYYYDFHLQLQSIVLFGGVYHTILTNTTGDTEDDFDQKYLLQYAMSKIKLRNDKN